MLAVVPAVVAPIVVASFFGFVMGGQSGKPETSKIKVAVVNDDQSSWSFAGV